MARSTGGAGSGRTERPPADSSDARPPGIALSTEQASSACRVGAAALERLAGLGAFPNAYVDADDGALRIPVPDLEATGLRPRRHLYHRVAIGRIAFGVLFALDAALKWFPSFVSAFTNQIKGASAGQPRWLQPWFRFWIRVFSAQPRFLAYATAVVETLIALALILGLARGVTYFAAALYSLSIWAIPEGFGGPYAHGVTDIGTGIIYAVLFLALYQLDTLADESPWSLDPWVERRFPWWRTLSEPWFRVKGGGTGTVSGRIT